LWGLVLIFSVAFVLLLVTDTPAAGPTQYASPCSLAVSKDGAILYVAEHSAKRVVCVDRLKRRIKARIDLPQVPNDLAVSPSGEVLWVAAGDAEGRILVVDRALRKVLKEIAVGHTPMAPVPAADSRVLFVCNRFSNDVSVVDLQAGTQVSRIPVAREPVAAAITPDGSALLVANHLPVGPADANTVAAQVSIIDVALRKRVADVLLPNGSSSLRGICVSPDGRYAYVTHILARYQEPTTQLDRGWMNTNALSIIDIAGRRWLNTVLLDDPDCGAANPWAVACTADGRWICATSAGTHELSVIDAKGLHVKLSGCPTPATVPDDLAFLADLRVRVRLKGTGPRSLAIAGSEAYVGEYFSDSLAIVDLDGMAQVAAVQLDTPAVMTLARQGESLFNDATWCFQKWQSCASCHPDAASDGLNWDLLNDGIASYKNTKSLLLSSRTPPMMATGSRANLKVATRAGMKFVQFSLRTEPDALALDAYLGSLEPVASPHLVLGHLSEAAERGKALFTSAGCGRCHNGPFLTNLRTVDVQTARGTDAGRPLDTPTLVNVWRTAPYLYEGQAATMKEVLTTFNADAQHGDTSAMTEQEINDLAEYVLSL
jgi:YVTN family beta-propeller protein